MPLADTHDAIDGWIQYLNELSMSIDCASILMDAQYYHDLYLLVTDAATRKEIETLAPSSKGIV